MGKVVFNESRLLPIFENFYNIFGIHISIFEPPFNVASYDEKFYYMNSVAFPFPGPSGICTPLRRSRIVNDRCVICDEQAVHYLMQYKKTYIYHCHLGLLEAMIPAVYDDEVVAIVIIGGVSGNEADDTFTKEFISYLLSADSQYYEPLTTQLKTLIRTVKVIDEKAFRSLCSLIEVFLEGAFRDGSIIVHKGSIITQLISYVMLNIDKPVTLQSASEEMGVTKSYLCRVVKREFGIPFSEYVNREKISRAKRLLLSTPMTINDIAEQLGYRSVAYFGRVFKQYTGLLPSRYRESSGEVNIVKK